MTLQLPEGQFADLGGPVHYREWPGEKGSGSSVFVLLHGLGGSYLSWVRVAPSLAARGRVLAMDLPGFGLSPRAGRPATLQASRIAVARFIERIAGRPVVLCGNSMGGSISIAQAALDPASVSALVLTNPAIPMARGGIPSPLVVTSFALYRAPVVGEYFARYRLQKMPPEEIASLTIRMVTADATSVPADVVEAHAEMARIRRSVPDAPRSFLEAARSLLSVGYAKSVSDELIGRVTAPTLLLHGEKDRFIPVAWARALAARRPDWRYRELPRLGHAVQLEDPDAWLDEVGGWLDRDSAAEQADRSA